MTRITLIDPEATSGLARQLLDGVHKRLGFLPTLMRVLAHSPAVLGGYLGFSSALANGVLSPALRERIAIAVAQANGCACCLAAHTVYGRKAGLSDEELRAARDAHSADPGAGVALRFAVALRTTNGHVSDEDMADVTAACISETAMIEIAATVAVNMFTNFVNNLAQTAPEFSEMAPPDIW